MRARSVALLMLALGCGLVASIGITQVIGKRGSEPADPTGETQNIYVALEEIPFGEPLSAQALRLEPWPKDKVPPGALSRIEDIQGRRTRSRLFAGEPVLENKLWAKGVSDGGYSAMIPAGYRTVSVKVDKVSGAGLILPGDRVDILLNVRRNPSLGIVKTATRTILQDVKVFAVNDVVETESQDDRTITAQTISLLVTPEHAQTLMLAEELGNIRLIMRSPEDDEIATVQDTTPGQLLDFAEAEDRQAEAALTGEGADASGGSFVDFLERTRATQAGPAVGPQPLPEGSMHRMQIVCGPEIRDVVLREQGESDSASDVEWWTLSDWDPIPGPGLPDAAAAEEDQEPVEQEQEEPPADDMVPPDG
jgi:pilus assembly protein CpaB